MKYRQLRITATGEWLNVLFTEDAPVFSVPELSHRNDIAAALGLQPAALEVIDADTDLRVGSLLALPLPPQPPQAPSEVRRVRLRELLALGPANWTAGQLREIAQLTAQEAVR